MRGVCELRGVRGAPIYSSGGWFAFNAHMDGDQETWQLLLLEMHLDGRPPMFGRPRRSAGPTWPPIILILLWQADIWALISFLVCIMRGAPICSARWALVSAYQRHHRKKTTTPEDANWGGSYFTNHE